MLIRQTFTYHAGDYFGIDDKQTSSSFLYQDVNDNNPVFSKSLYTITIPENTAVGKEILQVTAVDSDEDKNRALQYSIVSGNSLERFFIDVNSGTLYVRSVLDRDPPRNEVSFTLTVSNCDIPLLEAIS